MIDLALAPRTVATKSRTLPARRAWSAMPAATRVHWILRIAGRALPGAAVATTVIAALVFGLIHGDALAASAPDSGRPFEPRPASEPVYDIKSPEEDPARQRHIVTAADGVEIWTETWLPAPKDGRVPPATVPTVLHYSPYLDRGRPGSSTRPEQEAAHELLVPRGYAYTTAHVRGTGASGGCADPNGAATIDDGARVIEYLGRDAPWSNGLVGMVDRSTGSAVRWMYRSRGRLSMARCGEIPINREQV